MDGERATRFAKKGNLQPHGQNRQALRPRLRLSRRQRKARLGCPLKRPAVFVAGRKENPPRCGGRVFFFANYSGLGASERVLSFQLFSRDNKVSSSLIRGGQVSGIGV